MAVVSLSVMPEFHTVTTAPPEADALTLHDYLRVVRRRKWVVLLAVLTFMLASLLVDVAYAYLDPRIKYGPRR